MTKNRKNSDLSKRSYLKLKKTGRLKHYKDLILIELNNGSLSRRGLAELIKAKYPSNITAALSSLEDQGLIYRVGTEQDDVTGREVTLYGLTDRYFSLQTAPNSNRWFVTSEVTHQTDHSLTDKSLKNEF